MPVNQGRASYETTASSGVDASGSDSMSRTLSLGDHPDDHAPNDERTRRRYKARPNSTFILRDAVPSTRVSSTRQRPKSGLPHKGKEVSRASREPEPTRSHAVASGSNPLRVSKRATVSASSGSTSQDVSPGGRPESDSSSPRPSDRRESRLDADSTQIVSMALNLSESRRRASSQRYPSRSTPPRLASLPTSASKSNLSQHLQQQRKVSRTVSPRPAGPSRVVSGHRITSPLQPTHDSGVDDPIRYQFSTSTLSRAQKAKEHLELMSEYRRLLANVPPLHPTCYEPQRLAGSPPGSPRIAPSDGRPPGSAGKTPPLGRPYNPLQYIRNRKVRSRERKVIDGEQLGFGEVERVRTWVDKVHEMNAAVGAEGGRTKFTMPPFPGLDDEDSQGSPEPVPRNMRPRRPRVDWFFDPCDMVADAYWLEQDSHKTLIEDRMWRKIFPHAVDNSLSTPRRGEDSSRGLTPATTKTLDPQDDTQSVQDLRLVQTDDGAQHARDRAKLKLHGIKGLHHRHHSSSVSNYEPWSRRASLSDASGSESDLRMDPRKRTRHGRRDTITSDSNDLLQKQMLDMVAQEAREKELADVPESSIEHDEPVESASPNLAPADQTISRSRSMKDHITDFSDPEPTTNNPLAHLDSPVSRPFGRPSIEITDERGIGHLADADLSAPGSPQLNGVGRPPMVHSPASMPVHATGSSSPTRNPLSKVRRRLRDKSYDTGVESQSDADDDGRRPPPMIEALDLSEKAKTLPTDESYRRHRSSSSTRIRGDDPSSGLRGLFKAPRIDTVLKGGVSKLGDMIWRKDDSDSSADDESSDVSDTDDEKGQGGASVPLSPQDSRRVQDEVPPNAKHFYDSMPQFNHVVHTRNRPSASQQVDSPAGSRPLSRQPSRWEQLKPPRIDVRNSSPESTPQGVRHSVAEGAQLESRTQDIPEELRGADQRLNKIVSAPVPDYRYRRPNSQSWSITDLGGPSERAQLSRREVARMRTLVLSSGIKAMEINRRANELHKPLSEEALELASRDPRRNVGGLPWAEIAQLVPDSTALREEQVAQCDVYPLASRALAQAVRTSGQRWQASVRRFTSETTPELQRRTWEMRSRVADDFSHMTRQAADEADETNRELTFDQPLKAKHVVDIVEKLLRKRRRRFRWLRRMLWLMVEWALVGFMWFVWLVVTILRVSTGVTRGLWNGVRWLLWI